LGSTFNKKYKKSLQIGSNFRPFVLQTWHAKQDVGTEHMHHTTPATQALVSASNNKNDAAIGNA
jgi:lysophospholipid acyltransferase (LPLAT)-like uncharacterized protein